MTEISRRHFLYLSGMSPFIFQIPAFATQLAGNKSKNVFPYTKIVLQEAYKAEMTAYKNYLEYTSKALDEKYPNIAYLFCSFSYSEKIHADNYKQILTKLGQEVKPVQIKIDVGDTKSNLRKSAKNELKKIKTTYPDFIEKLENESYEEAIVACVYSWKSHKQHEDKIKQINKYSGWFFGSVSEKIEGLNLDFHVCQVCGSTIDVVPLLPCVICNRSKSNYRRIERPV